MRRIWFAGLVIVAALLATPPARAKLVRGADERVALVIGVAEYRNVPALGNPVNDARLIAPQLTALGFQTELVTDPDFETMKRALQRFGRRLEGAHVGLFYFSGHGMEVDGRNFLLPTTASVERKQDLQYEAFDVKTILDGMDAPDRVNLMFLDACRDNPFAKTLAAQLGTRSASVGRGLGRVDTTASGTLIAYATDPDNVAADGDGTNSPFTAALAKHIGTPGLDVRQMLTRVRADVRQATNGRQRPWDTESLDSDFYFVPGQAPSAVPAPAQTAMATPPPQPPPGTPTNRTFLIFFDHDKSELTARAHQIVQISAESAAALINAGDAKRVEISGYDDTSRGGSIAQALSDQRAEAVAQDLVRIGIPRTYLDVHGYGDAHPLVPTPKGVREPQNRRVEIIIH